MKRDRRHWRHSVRQKKNAVCTSHSSCSDNPHISISHLPSLSLSLLGKVLLSPIPPSAPQRPLGRAFVFCIIKDHELRLDYSENVPPLAMEKCNCITAQKLKSNERCTTQSVADLLNSWTNLGNLWKADPKDKPCCQQCWKYPALSLQDRLWWAYPCTPSAKNRSQDFNWGDCMARQ